MANCILTKMGALRVAPVIFLQPSRTTTSKHYNPKFKKLRAQKFLKVDLPDPSEHLGKMSPQKARQKLKESGILPPRPWMERPFYISATGGVFEPYVPPEGDGRASLVSTTRAKQAVQLLEKKSKSMMAIRKIKSFEEEFSQNEFVQRAQETYIKAHESLVNGDRKALRLYVSEKAYPEFLHNSRLKTIRWNFIESLEPPRIVHARCTDVINKENIFGQVTVRFHTRQQLAVYDRFGRLIHGSEILSKDVLEYIVFEKHLSNLYGTWRIHEKIIPDWSPPKEPSKLTRVMPEPEPEIVKVESEEQPQLESDQKAAIADK